MKKRYTLFLLSIVAIAYGQEQSTVIKQTVDPTTNITTTVTTTTTTVNESINSKKMDTFKKKNEIRIDPFSLLFIPALQANYERILSPETGLGVTLYISDRKEVGTNFSLSPYYRFYFGKKPAAGFFLEGFTMLSTINVRRKNVYSSGKVFYGTADGYPTESVADLAIGFGLGGKWMTNSGVVFELGFGVGRNLFKNYEAYQYDYKIVAKGGILIGYRF